MTTEEGGILQRVPGVELPESQVALPLSLSRVTLVPARCQVRCGVDMEMNETQNLLVRGSQCKGVRGDTHTHTSTHGALMRVEMYRERGARRSLQAGIRS